MNGAVAGALAGGLGGIVVGVLTYANSHNGEAIIAAPLLGVGIGFGRDWQSIWPTTEASQSTTPKWSNPQING